MYLRFITEYTCEQGKIKTGVFQALGYLIRSEQTFEYDKKRLNQIRDWFNKELERPTKFNKNSNKNKSNIAISWFKHTATAHLEKMYDLIPIFQNYNIRIDVIKKENPGNKIYEDEFQYVTIPYGKEKAQVI